MRNLEFWMETGVTDEGWIGGWIVWQGGKTSRKLAARCICRLRHDGRGVWRTHVALPRSILTRRGLSSSEGSCYRTAEELSLLSSDSAQTAHGLPHCRVGEGGRAAPLPVLSCGAREKGLEEGTGSVTRLGKGNPAHATSTHSRHRIEYLYCTEKECRFCTKERCTRTLLHGP